MDSVAVPEQPNYFWHWIFIFLLSGVGAYYCTRSAFLPPKDFSTARLMNGNADWYLVLKMPEVPTTDKKAVEQARERMSNWLAAIVHGGYHPMLLSEISAHKKQNVRLPEKTVVLVFDPGYRATYEAYSPVLESYGVPAVWLTHEDRIEHRDFRFVSKHLAQTMARSTLWDIGFYSGTSPLFSLAPEGRLVSSEFFKWARGANWQAKNKLFQAPVFHRLAVQPQWSGQDLLDQLNVEVPIESPSYLYVKSIDGRLKALSTPVRANTPAPLFDLRANPEKRVATLFWPSTEAQRDFTIDMSVKRIEGELWFFLRANEKLDHGVKVGITKDMIVVEQQLDGARRELALHRFSWPENQSLTCKIVWIDKDFKLQSNGKDLVKLSLPVEATEDTKFGLMVYDRIRGSSQVEQMTLTFSPLSQDMIKIIQSFTVN